MPVGKAAFDSILTQLINVSVVAVFQMPLPM